MAWWELDGVVNLRDVGGLATVDGRTTRSGVLLRSDNLQDLSPDDVSTLLDAGVRTVVDLRTEDEVEGTGPGPLSTRVDVLRCDLVPQGLAARGGVDRAVPSETAGPGAMDHVYLDYVRDAPGAVADALRAIADPGRGTVVVHCAAGKDRTGVVVALALSLVGVSRKAVVEDYALTGERIEAIRERLLAEPVYEADLRDRTLDSMRPHPANMERFLDRVDAEYGGVHELAASIGVDEETLARLSRRLLEPTDRT